MTEPIEPQTPPTEPAAAPEAPPAAEPAAPPPPITPERSTGSRFWREWVRPLLVVLVVMGSFRSVLADWNDVPSGSMKPTIVEGDRIFVNKAAYDLRIPLTRVRVMRWGEPKAGDIVVLFSPEDSKRLVKRVVGVPGDKLEMREGYLYINDKPLRYEHVEATEVVSLDERDKEDYRFWREQLGEHDHQLMLPPWPLSRGDFAPTVVPKDHYWVMGDNRSNSRDSRYFGFVERGAIVGRATRVVLSVDKAHSYKPRWERFFRPLE